MKRFLTILLATLALTAALCVTASASSFDGVAEELSAIGMFRGTGSGFALDDVPTRAQAAIMLVRLYGAEPEAQNTYRSGRITCPFTDVNETAAPYVAWLVDEGLANGTSATTFGAAEPCTARAYTIFLLRALGYVDNQDFTTATAQNFAAGLGILDTSALTGTFLRDDLAALTYQALGTDLKDGSTYLLDSLIEDGAIEANAARPIAEKIENLRALSGSSAAMSQGFAAGLDMNMAVTVTAAGASGGQTINELQQINVTGQGEIKAILDKTPQLAYDLTMDMSGETTAFQMWMKDGWMYIRVGESATKMEMPELMDAYQELMAPGAMKSSGASVLPFLERVTAKASGEDTVYTVELSDAFSSLLNTVIAQALTESGLPQGIFGEIAINGFTITYTVQDGALKSAAADAALTVGLDMNMGIGEQLKMTVGIVLDLEMDITATGQDVKIEYPDFSDFQEAA